MKKFNRTFMVLAVAAVLAIAAAPIMAQERHSEKIDKKSGFSVVIPEGFSAMSMPGLKFKALVRGDQFAEEGPQSIAFNMTKWQKKLGQMTSEHVDEIIAGYKKQSPDLEVLVKEEFVTTSGIQGYKVAVAIPLPDGRLIHQTSYMFLDQAMANNFIIQTMVLAPYSSRFAGVFDDAVKSLEWN